ncbi:MAG TPA: D-alanyl-D-alanine carboxypeptidase family protein [Rhizomicrobium sp.]|jgi:LAS superfamily LD-carboxypeptidase LdcB|nr:D-alanyl-D-alanine carboxypeptidase family protein [Rhizomicrobium sp.]
MKQAAATLLLLIFAAGAAGAAEESCNVGPRAAAQTNAASLNTMNWIPFRRPETGWAVYAPLIAEEIGVSCPPDSAGFAAALAFWQTKHKDAGTGVLDETTFGQMQLDWELRRPFVVASRTACPPPPDESTLAKASPQESYGGEQILLRPGALAAYRRLVAAARAALPASAANAPLLTIFSGYRSPQSDAARCLREQNCQGGARATCSAHRTGTAMDLYLGAAPGFRPDSSADANRLYLSRTAAYLWLAHNAAKYGFVNYPFEPWHWEWTGGG